MRPRFASPLTKSWRGLFQLPIHYQILCFSVSYCTSTCKQYERVPIFIDNNEQSQSGVLEIGPDSGLGSSLEYCFNISVQLDIYKEGLEVFVLSLQTDDNFVCLGQSLAVVRVQPNGGACNIRQLVETNMHNFIY